MGHVRARLAMRGADNSDTGHRVVLSPTAQPARVAGLRDRLEKKASMTNGVEGVCEDKPQVQCLEFIADSSGASLGL